MRSWWEYDPDGDLRHKAEPRTATPQVFVSEQQIQTGLLDANGNPLCRTHGRIGFLK